MVQRIRSRLIFTTECVSMNMRRVREDHEIIECLLWEQSQETKDEEGISCVSCANKNKSRTELGSEQNEMY